MEKLLPHNIEAERGVLGSIIIDPDMFAEVQPLLSSGLFYRDAHRTIYDAMLALYSRRESADFITVCDELERRNKLEEVGGAAYIAALSNGVPTSGNAAHYARIVARTAVLRSLIHAAGEIAAVAYDEVDATVALEKAEQLIFTISQQAEGAASGGLVPMAQAMAQLVMYLDRPESAGIETGFTDFDFITGGLQPQELMVLGGRSSEGKTAFLLNILYNLLQQQKRVAMFSLEMSLHELMRRLVSMHTGINSQDLRSRQLSDSDWQKVTTAAGDFDVSHIAFDETPALSIAHIRSRARRYQMQHGLDIVFVDYLQLATTDTSDTSRNRRRVEEVDEIVNGLKAMAKELNVPVVAVAALKRTEKDAGAAPHLDDLRESGNIGYTADIVAFIRRSREQKGVSLINVEKNRNGPIATGDDEIKLAFDPALTRFLNRPGAARDAAIEAYARWQPKEEVAR